MKTIEVLRHVVIVQPEFHIWSGRKKLRAPDVGLSASDVPEDLISLGSKRVCDPGRLKEFARLKKKAERECAAVGARFLGGFAIPSTLITALSVTLDGICRDFNTHKDRFLDTYEQEINAWIGQHPRYAEALRMAIPGESVVASGLSGAYHVYRITPADEAPEANLAPEVEGLAETLYHDISGAARKLYEASVLGKKTVSRKAIGSLAKIAKKLDGLSFLDHRMRPIVYTINATVLRMPATGPVLVQSDLNALTATLLLLSDVDKMKRHGEGLLSPSDDDGDEAQSQERIAPEAERVAPEPSEDTVVEEAEIIDGELIEIRAPVPEQRPPESHSFYF